MQIKLLNAFRLFTLAALAGLIGFVVLVQVYGYHRDFTQRAAHLRADFVEQQKQAVRREVERIVERIRYQRSILAQRGREQARQRVHQAHAVARDIHDRHPGLPDTQLRERVLDALRGLRFDRGIGYFFVVDRNGMAVMHPDRPELEGTDILDLRDSAGRPFVRELVELVKRDGEGSLTYTFSKPERQGNTFAKVSYVKLFEPFGWFIGTGVYLDDLEAGEKRRLLDEINQLRYGRNGYLFVDDWSGRVLAHGAQPELVGRNIWAFEDSNGVKVVQKLIAAARTEQGDFVHYAWRKPDSQRERPKVSFAMGIADWQWMIGSGLYTDDVEAEIAHLQRELDRSLRSAILYLLLGAGLIGLLMSVLTNRFYRLLLKDFSRFREFFERAVSSDHPLDADALRFVEFREQAGFANRMLRDKVAAQRHLEEHRAHLEEEVAERTRGLQEQTRKLAQARDQAEAANRAKSSFLANMSHELRTPLNAVLGFARLMLRDPEVAPRHRSQLALIDRSGEHLLALIDNVLDMSKVEAGRMSVQHETFDLYQLLDDLTAMMHPRADAKGITLEKHEDPALPRFLDSDPGKLRQILINLLGNAIKFTDQGSVRLRAGLADIGDGGTQLEISVQDSGCGISERQLPIIFDAFVQAGDGDHEGSGLGLSICKRMVELLGGHIEVCSRPGHGSTFALLVPVQGANGDGAAAHTANRQVSGLAPGQPQRRLLIVEDNPDNRRLLHSILETVGLPAREAMDGAQAVRLFEAWRPELIWMDLRMPVMDGREATRRIRTLPGGQACRIIAVTASAFREEQAHLLASGFDDFLRKPFREPELFRLLERHLDVRFEYRDLDRPEAWSDQRLRQALAELPADWTARFARAILIGNVATLEQLMEAIRPHHPDLASHLEGLVGEFAFDRLADLVDHLPHGQSTPP